MYPTQSAANAALLILCEDIAYHVDGFEAFQEGWETGMRSSGTGVEFRAYFGGNPIGDRVAICVVPPRHATDWQSKQLKAKITVSTRKGAEYIAERITKELLPSYLAVLEDVKDAIQRTARLVAERDRLVTTIASILPSARRDEYPLTKGALVLHAGWEGYGSPPAGQMKVTTTLGLGTNELHVHGLDAQATAHIAAVIADFIDRRAGFDAEDAHPDVELEAS